MNVTSSQGMRSVEMADVRKTLRTNPGDVRMFAERKLALIVDLDETLICARMAEDDGRRERGVATVLTTRGAWKVVARPHLMEFLRIASNKFDVFIATLADQSYASQVLSELAPDWDRYVVKVFTRKSFGSGRKFIPELVGTPDMTVIVDDRSDVWQSALLRNWIEVPPYRAFADDGSRLPGAATDVHLLHTLGKLEKLHAAFYSDPPPRRQYMSAVLGDLMRSVLSGAVVYTYGATDDEFALILQAADALGAKVVVAANSPGITHVILLKKPDDYFPGMATVSIRWLTMALATWDRPDDGMFSIKRGDRVERPKIVTC